MKIFLDSGDLSARTRAQREWAGGVSERVFFGVRATYIGASKVCAG